MGLRGCSKYSNEIQKSCVDMYAEGFSLAECCTRLGPNASTIRDWCIKQGILRTPQEGRRLQYLRGVGIGETHYRWNGGRNKTRAGYVMVHMGHGKKNKAEHIIVAEVALGRKLKRGEVIHHINGDKSDNKNDNLLICDRSYHQYLHTKMSTLYMKEHFGRNVQ